jgi:hypothetical protein
MVLYYTSRADNVRFFFIAKLEVQKLSNESDCLLNELEPYFLQFWVLGIVGLGRIRIVGHRGYKHLPQFHVCGV